MELLSTRTTCAQALGCADRSYRHPSNPFEGECGGVDSLLAGE
jgi:hypothetical protein